MKRSIFNMNRTDYVSANSQYGAIYEKLSFQYNANFFSEEGEMWYAPNMPLVSYS